MRVLTAGLLGGLAMFVWSAVANIALPLGTMGMSTSPEETRILTALNGSLANNDGLYVLPAAAMSGKAPRGASAFLVYHGPAYDLSITPAKLAGELATEVLGALLAAFLLGFTRLSSFAGRTGFVVSLGLLVAGMTNLSYLFWFGFPLEYTLAYGFTQLVGFALAGLVIAAVLGRVRPADTLPG